MKSFPHTHGFSVLLQSFYGLQALRNFESSNFFTTVLSLLSLKLLEVPYQISLALAVLKGKIVFNFEINTLTQRKHPYFAGGYSDDDIYVILYLDLMTGGEIAIPVLATEVLENMLNWRDVELM